MLNLADSLSARTAANRNDPKPSIASQPVFGPRGPVYEWAGAVTPRICERYLLG